MKAALIVTSIVIALAIPAHAIECQLSKGVRGYHWAWREIDGHPCWYEGLPGMAKSELHWSASPHAVAPRPTEPSPPDQTTLSNWKGNGDGKLIEAGTDIHVLRTDPPPISRAITFDKTLLAMRGPSPSANASFHSRWSAWQGNPNVMQFDANVSGQSK
jgi:hypothetical protein